MKSLCAGSTSYSWGLGHPRALGLRFFRHCDSLSCPFQWMAIVVESPRKQILRGRLACRRVIRGSSGDQQLWIGGERRRSRQREKSTCDVVSVENSANPTRNSERNSEPFRAVLSRAEGQTILLSHQSVIGNGPPREGGITLGKVVFLQRGPSLKGTKNQGLPARNTPSCWRNKSLVSEWRSGQTYLSVQHTDHLGSRLFSLVILHKALLTGAFVDLSNWLIEWLSTEKPRGVWSETEAVMNPADHTFHSSLYQRLGVSSRGFAIHSRVAEWHPEASHVPCYNYGAVILCFHGPTSLTRLQSSLNLGLCLISFLYL